MSMLSHLRIKIDRGELAGAFGDIGTDLPLLTGMILASGMNPATVLMAFGAAQIAAAVLYGMPMPVQPLKAVAAMVIAGGVTSGQVLGAGLGIGIIMLILTLTGLLERLRVIIPKAVIRGIQLGLGIKLSLLALTKYIPADGRAGIVLAIVCGAIILLLLRNKKCPGALVVVGLGFAYAFFTGSGDGSLFGSVGLTMPQLGKFTMADVIQGTLILALPQIPLSLGNSLFATHLMAKDLFPERKVSLKKIGLTYSVLNMIMPFFGGIPVCHGSGGMAGHHVFGGRTGGSVLVYGVMLLAAGLFFGSGTEQFMRIFPLPILGVMLLTEGVALMRFAADVLNDRFKLAVTAVTASAAVLAPSGFLVGLVAGTALAYVPNGLVYLRRSLGLRPMTEHNGDAGGLE